MGNKGRICVIGAGFCGLGVAKALADAGIDFEIFEKEQEIGGNWFNGVYDSTHIISSRDTTAFEEYPMPSSYSDFPSRAEIFEYLKNYADHFELRNRIRFGVEVTRVSPLDPQGLSGWLVELSSGEKQEFRGVVVCNGHHWDKRVPAYPGEFTGVQIHSKDYKRPGDFKGESILVVGAGNSGCDLAVEAALAGKHTAISMRRGYYFLPKTVLGVPTVEYDRPWLPLSAQKLFLKAAMRVIHGPNEKYGLEKPDHDLFEHHPIVNSQLLHFLRHGKVAPKPDISRFEGKRVHFKDGSELEVDTIVWCTGFNISFPFLDPSIFDWENGIPKRVAGVLPRNMANLYVFGLAQPRGGAGPLISRSAKLVAEMICLQQSVSHPISRDLERLKPASAKHLFGVSEVKRELKMGALVLRGLAARYGVSGERRKASLARPKLRAVKLPFGERAIPKHWLLDSALPTHLANGLSLVFPAGERYFIRSAKKFRGKVSDPGLKSRIDGFIAQEVKHSGEHERSFDVLRGQGFKIDRFLRWYEKLAYDGIERALSPRMNLAVTAALEHYTATFARLAIEDGAIEHEADPVMRDLFLWHAAEEIEHKSVAYDLLCEAAPGYFTRVAGMLVATGTLSTFWAGATLTLLAQDSEASVPAILSQIRKGYHRRMLLRGRSLKAFFEYLKPGFHPDQKDDSAMAHRVISELSARAVS